MVLTLGARIGPYEVLSTLGKGGMGEVYRARDSRLKRDVALKVLAEAVTHDASRVARFRREAEILASLNHPHIGAIFGVEDAEGLAVLVLELVEGPTLADRIAHRRLPLEEALPIARQIASALEFAHDQGIVHRDLKPANIKVRPDDTVKVLDFGLAKAADPLAASDASQWATHSAHDLSSPGAVLGTARYMSPEQAAGKPLDKRTDIWAFGVVLFEMLTGDHAFEGESAAHVIAAVMRAEPDWTLLPPDTPAAIRRLLRRCLEKDRTRRLDSARAVAIELDEALVPEDEAAPAARARRSVLPKVIGAVVAGGLLAFLAGRLTQPPTEVPAPRTTFAITPPAALPWRPTPQAASRDFAIAPDGTFLVYRTGEGGQGQLVVRWFDRLEVEPLAGVIGAQMPFVSPDSRWIGYFDNELVLRKVPVAGGAPVTLAQLPVLPRGTAWIDDATIIVGTNSPTTGLMRVPAGGGEATVLTTQDRAAGEEGHLLPAGLPGAEAVLFTIGAAKPENAQIALLDLKTGQRTTVLRGARDAQYVSSGHLVYMSGLAMSAVRFDLRTKAMVGEPVRVMDALAATPTTALNVAVTSTGTLVYVPGGTGSPPLWSLVWVDRRGRETPTGAPDRPYESVRISPDGTRAVVSIRDQQNDLWLWDFSRQVLTRLTFDADIDMSPAWTPDGLRVVYASARAGVFNMYIREVDGSGPDVRLTAGANLQLPTSILSDGTFVIGHEVRPKTAADLVRVPLGQGRDHAPAEAEDLVTTPFNEWSGEVSPDGRFLAYLAEESGQAEVYVRPLSPGAKARWQVSSGASNDPAWTKGGRELIYTDGEGRLMAVPVDLTGDTFQSGVRSPLGWRIETPYLAWRTFDVSPDGMRFLVLKKAATAPQAEAPVGFVVVQRWLDELRRLVPVS